MHTKTFDKFVFDTHDTVSYRFPTHSNELVMDRSAATTSEVFIVILQPGEAPPLHVHHDTEQVFYVLQGSGELQTGPDGGQRFPLTVGNTVRIPPGTHHRILCQSSEPMRYFSVDCFVGGCPAEEPTWESHVRVVCQQNGWDFAKIRNPSSK